MACKQPTSQQLAYLDELKQRLQELRVRQETFMEETAEILRNISTDRPMPTIANTPRLSAIEDTQKEVEKCVECAGSIKQLIQRFEDLRQTSRQFSDQPLPEELVGVDVRRLLRGYEKLIVEGDMLQKSWLLLKKTTESCARQSNKDEPKLNMTSSKNLSFAEQTTAGQHKLQPSVISATNTRFYLESSAQTFDDDDEQSKWGKRPYERPNRQRFGALLQLAIRINPFNKCRKFRTASKRHVKD